MNKTDLTCDDWEGEEDRRAGVVPDGDVLMNAKLKAYLIHLAKCAGWLIIEAGIFYFGVFILWKLCPDESHDRREITVLVARVIYEFSRLRAKGIL